MTKTPKPPVRRRLPDTRGSVTHKFTIHSDTGEQAVYVTVGLYEDGRPGELFINAGKAGSTLNSLLDIIGIQASFALQYGIPLEVLCVKFRGMSFEPAGKTGNPEIPQCSSIIDYIFRWLERTYLTEQPHA